MRNFRSLLLTCIYMLLSVLVMAQTPAPQNTVKLFFEKVFIHTDRALYAPGDDLWFKAYVTNARDNHLIATSKNLYVELIAPADTMVKKEIVHLDNGTGKGDIALPANLPAGTYRLRAYTNWMRNFSDNFIFEKSITITSTAALTKAPAAKQAARPAGNSVPSRPVTASGPVIRFFPEGGSLVNELSSIVAVKAEDSRGNGLPLSGPILSTAGDTVARFTCDSTGMGLFILLPFASQSYRTTANYKGQNITAQLPVALNSGLGLKVTKKDTLIYVTISCNSMAAASLAGKALTLVIKNAGSTVIDQQIQLTNNQALIKISESILPEGIAAITLYDEQHKPNCERLIYNDRPTHAPKLTIATTKITYAPRERVTINLTAINGSRQPVAGNFSVAVVDAGLNPAESDNIRSYLMLRSEIKGDVTNAGRYFDTTNINRAKQLDLLMLTQGWRDFIWKRLADAPINIAYLPEQGFTLSGRVKKETNTKPIPAANVTLSTPKATGQRLFFAKTDSTGTYYFDNIQLYGDQNVRLSTRDAKGKPNGVIELDSLSARNLPINKTDLSDISPNKLSPAVAAEVEKRVAINKKLDTVTTLKEVNIKANRNVRLRDQTAISGGYKDEVLTVTKDDLDIKNLRAYILYASKQAHTNPDPLASGNDIVFRAWGQNFKPRIIVNNEEVPFVWDDDENLINHFYEQYYSLPMTVVEKVVIKHLIGGLDASAIGGTEIANAMGNSVAGTTSQKTKDLFVIFLTLKPGALQRNNGGITTANIHGYYEARNFYKPIYSSPSARPDMRNTIHWEPLVKTDATGKTSISFYNADPKTNVRIIVQGITDTGEPVSAVKSYVVK